MKVYVVKSGTKVVLETNNRWSPMTLDIPVTFEEREFISEDIHSTIFRYDDIKYHVEHKDIKVFG